MPITGGSVRGLPRGFRRFPPVSALAEKTRISQGFGVSALSALSAAHIAAVRAAPGEVELMNITPILSRRRSAGISHNIARERQAKDGQGGCTSELTRWRPFRASHASVAALPRKWAPHGPQRTVRLLACADPHPRNYASAGTGRPLAEGQGSAPRRLVGPLDCSGPRGRRCGPCQPAWSVRPVRRTQCPSNHRGARSATARSAMVMAAHASAMRLPVCESNRCRWPGVGLEAALLAGLGEDMAALAHRHQLARLAEAAVQQRVGAQRLGQLDVELQRRRRRPAADARAGCRAPPPCRPAPRSAAPAAG